MDEGQAKRIQLRTPRLRGYRKDETKTQNQQNHLAIQVPIQLRT
jgi:hypothetical protein